MNIVTVCRGGNVRSVAAKMILRRYFDHETLACGVDRNSPKTLAMLFDWADRIVLLHEEFQGHVPEEFAAKMIVLHVGTDIWGDPFANDLQLRIFDLVMDNPELRGAKQPLAMTVVYNLDRYREKIAARNFLDADL